MSYYQYMVSVYRSCLPQLNRSLRSSSVTRMSPEREPAPMPSRFTRANTVGPTDYQYTSAMPFTYQYKLASERYNDTRNRLSSVEPLTYRRAFTTSTSSSATTGYSSYDYKVGTLLSIAVLCQLKHSRWKLVFVSLAMQCSYLQ